MYDKTVTLFNRKKDNGDIVWYSTLLTGVSINVNDTTMTGDNARDYTSDVVKLVVPFTPDADNIASLSDKTYLRPKEWAREEYSGSNFTFQSGRDFDFFIYGDYSEMNGERDSDYMPNGFYEYMRKTYDDVYAVATVSVLTLLPHFEIAGK